MNNIQKAPLSVAVALVLGVSSTQAAVIEEVVVTASKRAQSAQDLGVSVSAFAGNDIQDLALDQPTDLAAHTPGLTTTNATSGGTPIFAIRGIGLDDFNINNSSGVGVYVDEVFASSPMLLGFQLLDLERVEVLKGPQGTLYGKNTTGGAINFVSAKPDEFFAAELRAKAGRWNRHGVEGFVNGALSESVNGRLAFRYDRQSEGWQRDIDTGNRYGEIDRLALVSKFAIAAGDNTDILLNVHYGRDRSLPLSPQNDDSEARANDTLFLGGLFDGQLDVPADARSVRVGDLPLDRDEEGYGASITVNHSLDSIDITSITAFEHYERSVVDNYDGTAAAFLDLVQDGELKQYSQEIRLTSDGSGDYSWVAGLNYSVDDVDVDDDFLLLDSAGVNLTTAYTQKSESFGAYFHNEYQLEDSWRLIAGLRYSRDLREFVGGTRSSDGSDFLGAIEAHTGTAAFAGQSILSQNSEVTENNISGKLGFEYDLEDGSLIYGSWSSSYKGGLFYGGVGAAQGVLDYVKPEEVTAYELGFKTLLLDDSLQLNGAVYRYDYEDRQSLVIVEDPVLFLVATLANVPESTITGAEIELQWKPSESFDVRGGISYIDSEVKNDLSSSDVRGLNLLGAVPAGTDLSQAPQWSFNLLLAHEWTLAGNTLRAQADYSWSDQQFAALADPVAQYGPIKSLGGRLTLRSANDVWELSLWGKNLADQISESYSFTNNSAARTVYRQQQRSFGVEAVYRFD